MHGTGRYRSLIFSVLITTVVGCQATKRASWQAPLVASPRWTSSLDDSPVEQAEEAYAEAMELEREGEAACVDYYFRTVALAWPHVEQQIAAEGIASGRIVDLYHSSLTQLINAGQRYGRFDPRRGLYVQTTAGGLLVPTRHHGFPWRPEDFDHLLPVGDYGTEEINHAYQRPGLGIPVVAMHRRQPHERFRRETQNFAATVVLRSEPAAACPYVIDLFDPLRAASVTTGGRSVPLERDLTAPFVYVLSRANRDYIRGFIQPGASTQNSGLFMIEPYQRGKVPVVFVHGLLSDRLTWGNLANEILSQPDLTARYQLWGYEYATGQPFLGCAAMLRRQLQEARWLFDPHGADAALSQTVLVGHSMGGLISKLQVTHSGHHLWEAVSNRPLENIVTTPQTRMQLAEAFFFQPSPMVTRVIFIGTPHRGSPCADRPIGRLGSRLVEEPETMREEHQQLIRDNPSAFSAEFSRAIPTSVDLLEPESPLLNAMDRLPHDPRVQLHSIVGSGFFMIGACDSDSVVPVESARKAGVVTERIIDAKHVDLHKSAEGVAELLCILRKHLREIDGM